MSRLQCPNCQSFEVHRSRRRGAKETLFLRLLMLRPYRCADCHRRHYESAFRGRRISKAEIRPMSITIGAHRCPHCESFDWHRSKRGGAFEHLVLRLLLFRPYRCRACDRRHYGLVMARRRASKLQVAPQAVFSGPRLRLLKAASALMVLVGVPVFMAASGPIVNAWHGIELMASHAQVAVLGDRPPILPAQEPPAPVSVDQSVNGSDSLVLLTRKAAYEMNSGIKEDVLSQAPSGPRTPIGSMHSSGEVFINETKSPELATIFEGDTIRTGAEGNAALQIPNKGTLMMLHQTQMSFGSAAREYLAELKLGSISFRSVARVARFEILVGSLVIASNPLTEDSATVLRDVDGSVIVEVTLGSVRVRIPGSGEEALIKAGRQVYITPEGAIGSAIATGTTASSAGPTSHRGKWVALGVGGGAAAVAVAVLSSHGGAQPISPSAP